MKMQDVEIGAPGTIMPPFENVLKNAQKNEQEGYAALWWPDHLMSWYPESIWTPEITEIAKSQKSPHAFLDVVATMGAVGACTSKIRLGTSVTETIRRHPAVMAQAFVTLDHISKGRTILGLGAGEAENITPYGMDFSNPVSKLEEAIKIIRLLWDSNGKVDFDGTYYKLKDAVLDVDPYTPGGPPIWIGAHGPRMLAMAGKYCDGWIPTYMEAAEYGKKLAAIRKAAVEAGRDPNKIVPGMFCFMVVDEDHETCHRLLDSRMLKHVALLEAPGVFERLGYEHPLAKEYGKDFNAPRDYIPTRRTREQTLAAIDAVPSEVVQAALIHGTPTEIVDRIGELVDQGLQHICLWNQAFFGDLRKVRSSFECLAKVVGYIRAG